MSSATAMRLSQALTPSFRNRLRLFFVVIVLVPILAVTVVLFRLVGESDRSQVDAALSEAQQVAEQLYEGSQARAQRAAEQVAADQRLANAIDAGRRGGIRRRVEALAMDVNARYLQLALPDLGRFEVGRVPALAVSQSPLQDSAGRRIGSLTVSVVSRDGYPETVADLTGAEVILSRGGETLASTLPGADPDVLPGERGPADVGGVEYRATAFDAKAPGGDVRVHMLMTDRRGSVQSPDPAGIVALVAFLLLAFAAALAISRRLQSEVEQLLHAARRLGSGDFSVKVPTQGDDEFAALGQEFNAMARELERRLAELQRERTRLQEAIRRVGESFAKGLDRIGLLEIVVQTAVDGIGASCGRATMRASAGEQLREVARTGDPQPFVRALHAAEAAVIDAGQVAEIQMGGASALAAPLGTEGGQVIGIVSLARSDRPFTREERDLFAYLTNQASVSVENQDLHETVQRQAVTDELTGLFNHRRFQEVMAVEVERARRYGHEMGLIMLDIDNFKQVNDTHGHLQGDLVLREVARVLRLSSREIDEPARYGGEEMAVALPQTDLEGAYQFAERVRRRIEALEFPLPDGDGTLKVTASFGAASLGAAGATDKDALVAAADAALYEAKRSGKNRTVRASRASLQPDVHGVAATE